MITKTDKMDIKTCFLILFLYLNFAHAQDSLELVGIGASLPVEVYEAWAPAFESYRSEFVDLDNEYFAMGTKKIICHFRQLFLFCFVCF